MAATFSFALTFRKPSYLTYVSITAQDTLYNGLFSIEVVMEQPAPEEPSFPDMKSEAEEDDLRAAWAMEDDDPVATFAQHPTLYYPDGNVILSCEDEDTLFRVHRSILAKGCPALNDLITDSERRDRKPDLLAGCVHIPLSDSRKDVETLLRIVYHDL